MQWNGSQKIAISFDYYELKLKWHKRVIYSVIILLFFVKYSHNGISGTSISGIRHNKNTPEKP